MILRMCNDLLKRLSRTVDASFCGRILVLLAHALPLCEKSGLNLVSHFNLGNVTKYDMVNIVSFVPLVLLFLAFFEISDSVVVANLFPEIVIE